ncbi:YaiI/YqxD family protein [Jannaschia sp. M317]|uniref:YaiI/YqxD family protein n=1 Tax=Jannaschia sp. M317 TaxID=2867011 RepID=UPI0021A4F50A|nr:YaiI/YqxD family protein [Jannaschia sp. M317]UWQ16226.1 YaiI/YqxD family protein [Jannaschia sp. M317]
MILIDADACPVKAEITEVALRRNMQAIFVAGSFLRLTDHPLIKLFVAGDAFDAADDAIAQVARPGTVTITADILLAERVLKVGGAALDPRGREYTEASIGETVATRDLMAELRPGMMGQAGGQSSGPAPYNARDRAAFKNALDRVLTRIARVG